jgi:hypothetical protein
MSITMKIKMKKTCIKTFKNYVQHASRSNSPVTGLEDVETDDLSGNACVANEKRQTVV